MIVDCNGCKGDGLSRNKLSLPTYLPNFSGGGLHELFYCEYSRFQLHVGKIRHGPDIHVRWVQYTSERIGQFFMSVFIFIFEKQITARKSERGGGASPSHKTYFLHVRDTVINLPKTALRAVSVVDFLPR